MNNKLFKALVALFMCISILPLNAVRAEGETIADNNPTGQVVEQEDSGLKSGPEETIVPEVSATPETTAVPETPGAVPTEQPADSDQQQNVDTAPTPAPTPEASPALNQDAQTLNEENTPIVGVPDPNVHAIRIGAFTYNTMDEAIAAALDMEEPVIEITEDVEITAGINMHSGKKVNKLKIIAPSDLEKKPVITFKDLGIALQQGSDRARFIGFENVDIVMNDIAQTPFNEWTLYSICTSPNSTIELKNVKMNMNGNSDGVGDRLKKTAIFLDHTSSVDLIDSELLITNYGSNALDWNGPSSKSFNLNLTNSRYISDGNRSGINGTFTITAVDSEITVINSTGNATNGSHFYLTRSTANFSNNRGHGISAGKLVADDSTITTENNRYYGITASSTSFTDSMITTTNNGFNGIKNGSGSFKNGCKFDMVNSTLEVTGNGYNPGDNYAGMQLVNSIANIDATSVLKIQGNANNGLRILNQRSDVNFADGAELTVTGNHSKNVDGGKGYGGGIYLMAGALRLPVNAKIYNNDAAVAGDDIYVGMTDGQAATLTLAPVAQGLVLDASLDPAADCDRKIDEYYYDGADHPRWKAHGEAPLFVKKLAGEGNRTINTVTGIKAAHGLKPISEPEVPAEKWEVSKSKEATNLDKNYETKVTLSLPATQQQVETDVVFVLDKSKSAELKAQVIGLLENLNETIKDTQAVVNVGVVTFNKRANRTLELTTLNDQNLGAMRNAVNASLQEGGTNLHAGVLEGKKMLDEDQTVDASRKYLITVSDGITYMFGEEPTAVAWSFDADGWRTFAGPDNWRSKYGTDNAPADWNAWIETTGDLIRQNGSYYDYPYGGTIVNATAENYATYKTDYATSVDKALYLTYQTYKDAQNAGYNCFALNPERTTGSELTWGPSFIDFLAGGKVLSFEDIENEIIYFLDEGSFVEDYIGYTDEYNFDLKKGSFELTVGGQKLAGTQISENVISFGDDRMYVVEYVPGNMKEEEHFVWTINTPVKVTEPVRLSYVLKLSNPKTEEGTYGVYDQFGTEGTNGLFTNNSAVIYPVDSLGQQHPAEAFARPSVSYTVKKQIPVNPNVTPEHPVPLPDNTPADTGDNSNMMLWVVLLIVAAGGAAYFVLKNRKKQ